MGLKFPTPNPQQPTYNTTLLLCDIKNIACQILLHPLMLNAPDHPNNCPPDCNSNHLLPLIIPTMTLTHIQQSTALTMPDMPKMTESCAPCSPCQLDDILLPPPEKHLDHGMQFAQQPSPLPHPSPPTPPNEMLHLMSNCCQKPPDPIINKTKKDVPNPPHQPPTLPKFP